MDEKKPSRRKDKDNPYTTIVKDGKYFVMFNNIHNESVTVEIDKDVYALFNTFELEDVAFMNEFDRHAEHSELGEQELVRRAEIVHITIDDIVATKMENEALMAAIDKLPDKQRRRVILYFFHGLTYEEIARIEKCKYQAIQYSIRSAIKKLKNYLAKKI